MQQMCIRDSFNTEYNDYHFILNSLSPERFNIVKSKPYIDKIYIQKSEGSPMEMVDSSYVPTGNIKVYLKYDNIKNVCKYSNYIISGLNLSENEAKFIKQFCGFNKQLLTANGFIDVEPNINNDGFADCKMRLNYSYIIRCV